MNGEGLFVTDWSRPDQSYRHDESLGRPVPTERQLSNFIDTGIVTLSVRFNMGAVVHGHYFGKVTWTVRPKIRREEDR